MRKEDTFLQLPLQERQVPDVSFTDQALPHFPLQPEVKKYTQRSEDAPSGSLKVSEEKKPVSFADNSLLVARSQQIRWIDQMSKERWTLVTQQPRGHLTSLSTILTVPQHCKSQREVQKSPEDVCRPSRYLLSHQ